MTAITIENATTLGLGTVTAASGTLSLTTTGEITQTGVLQVGTLTGTGGGIVLLNNGSNQISALSTFSRGGDLTLDDNVALTVNGALRRHDRQQCDHRSDRPRAEAGRRHYHHRREQLHQLDRSRYYAGLRHAQSAGATTLNGTTGASVWPATSPPAAARCRRGRSRHHPVGGG